MVTRIQALAANHSQATTTQVGLFVNNRHRSLLESKEWSRRKQEILIAIAADNSTGTISVTKGQSTATVSGGTLTSADQQKSIKIASDNEIYILKIVSGSTITFGDLNGTTVSYQGTTNSSATFNVFQRFYSLGTAIESIISVVHNTRKLDEVSQEYLDVIDPNKTSTGTQGLMFARGPRDMSGANDLVQIEFSPRLTSTTVVRATIKKGHSTLSGTNNPIVPSGPVEWFGAVDTCYFLFAKTGDEKWGSLADKYNTEAEKCLEREWLEDQKKFGLQQAIRDVGAYSLVGTDYEVTTDIHPPGR